MNISIVVPSFPLFVRSNEFGLAKSLVDLGHRVNIITTSVKSGRELMDTKTFKESVPQNFEVNYVPNLIDIFWETNPFVYGISEYVKESDVVLLQEDYPFICHKAFHECKKKGIPTTVSSEHITWNKNFFVRNIYKVYDLATNKKLREGVNAITAHCTAAKEFWINELGVRRGVEVIHVGVDTQLFQPKKVEKLNLLEGKFKILTVARATPVKGLRYLIEAMVYVSKRVSGVKCYILGKGSEREKLGTLVNKLQLGSVVSFIDKAIPNRQMPELYSQCDIYVQPSITEPFGIAVLEAMACRKPVVGTNVGGMRDTIEDGVSGYRVEPMNSRELGEKITKLLLDPEKMEEMGKNARERAKKFDWKIIGQKYNKLIEKVVQKEV
ncbi:MAG: glycosyltransferase family 4 protein [Candidatus Freyarchaeum deiterrae]